MHRAWKSKSVFHPLNDKWWQESEGAWIAGGEDGKQARVHLWGVSNYTKKFGDYPAGYGESLVINKPSLVAEVGRHKRLHENQSLF